MREADFADTLERLSNSAWAYAALASALECGLVERLHEPVPRVELIDGAGLDPGLAHELIEALIALGVVAADGSQLVPTPAFETLASPRIARVLRSGIRSDHLQIQDLLARIRDGERATGWTHEDPVALTAQGETGTLIGPFVEALLPQLEGLAERMAMPGARILDVGAGVGVVSTELCRLWPEAEAVGLEPHRTARELGSSRIAAAGLESRIALRDERVERLGEVDAYDLAFLPQPFLGRECLEAGLPRVHRALRPGGWLIVLTHELPDGDPLAAAARRFRAQVWGGGVIEHDELIAIMAESGFGAIRGDYPVGSFRAICGQRAGDGAGILRRDVESERANHAGALPRPA